ncbi:MAG: DUF1566 domain-containing protein [Deltaproteobacteria bacterium]|nr:DUF1566 domain-containing protein [Deltaproteobacteria bacterium]
MLLPILFIGVDAVDSAEQIYHSIHVASFRNLQNANRYVNALTKKGKMVFWKKTDVPGKGEWYRVYLGKYRDRAKAVEFWKKLEKEKAVSYFGIHEFRETVQPSKIKETPAITPPEETDTVQASTIKEKATRFVDNRDGTVTDKETNLMWIKNGWKIDFVSASNWQDAVKRCEKFSHVGYKDWRLPSIEEWKSLLDPEKEYPALVEPNHFENIIVHMPYWSGTEFGYGSGSGYYGHSKNRARAYTVMLYYGRVNHQNKNKMAFILPVRSID